MEFPYEVECRVSVNTRSLPRDERGEIDSAVAVEVERRLRLAAEGIPRVWHACTSRRGLSIVAEIECGDRGLAEQLRARIGEGMSLVVGGKDVTLPVTFGITVLPKIDIAVLERLPSRIARGGPRWNLLTAVPSCESFEAGSPAIRVEIVHGIKPCAAATLLRDLADRWEVGNVGQ